MTRLLELNVGSCRDFHDSVTSNKPHGGCGRYWICRNEVSCSNQRSTPTTANGQSYSCATLAKVFQTTSQGHNEARTNLQSLLTMTATDKHKINHRIGFHSWAMWQSRIHTENQQKAPSLSTRWQTRSGPCLKLGTQR